MVHKTLAAGVVSILLIVSPLLTKAASSSDLTAGQACATKLFKAAQGKSPTSLMQNAGKLVNFDSIISAAAAINGDILTQQVRTKYEEGMKDFAEHFVIPRLSKQLQRVPRITVASASGNTLTISEGGDGSLTVLRSSCLILNFKGGGASLIGMLARHIKENYM